MSLSSLPQMARNYYYNDMTTEEKARRNHCRECDAVLSGHTKVTGRPMKEVNLLHLCSTCSIISVGSQNLPGCPKIQDLLNPDFLRREYLACSDDIGFGEDPVTIKHTKVYTCEDCLGPLNYATPFKSCICCIGKKSKVMLDKEYAVQILKKLEPLTKDPLAGPYLIKRRDLTNQNQRLKRMLRECNSHWVDPNSVIGDRMGANHEDERAIKTFRSRLATEVSGSSVQLIPDLASIIAEHTEILPACNADGSVRRV
jgi:RNase P subunit RPR2